MICEEFRETLEHEGYEVDFALNGKEGLQKIQAQDYNLVFLDSAMPFMDGKKVLERIRHFSRVPVALISGFLTESKEKEILHLGAMACLRKPFCDDLRYVGICLDVIDQCWLVPQPGLGRDRRLDARRSTLALNGAQESGLLANMPDAERE